MEAGTGREKARARDGGKGPGIGKKKEQSNVEKMPRKVRKSVRGAWKKGK